MSRAVLFAAGLVLLATPAHSEWLKIAEDWDVSFFIDRDKAGAKRGSIVIKSLQQYKRETWYAPNVKYRAIVRSFILKCKKKTAIHLETTYYDDPMATGIPVVTIKAQDANEIPFPPDSPLGVAKARFCK